MIRNGAGYGSRHLQYSDYVDEQHRVIGQWYGRGAEALGLSGAVANDELERLRMGLHPGTGEKLRQRILSDTQRGRALFDFTLSAPKTVSIQALVGDDTRLIEAHERAVKVAIEEMETLADTRVRRDGARTNRPTGNLVVAVYQHDTSRKLDPQLHAHCIVPNLTSDPVEARWKALEAGRIYNHLPYLTEVYRNALAAEVTALGYAIESVQDDKGRNLGFELAGLGGFAKRFSQRSDDRDAAIAAFVARHGRDPSKREVAILVRESRTSKLLEIATEKVKALQRARMSSDELEHLRMARDTPKLYLPFRAGSQWLSANQALQHAQDAIFERVSVSSRQAILAEALRFSRGRVTHDAIKTAYDKAVKAKTILSDASGERVSTELALKREREIREHVDRARGKSAPIATLEFLGRLTSARLAEGQRQALLGILGSRDGVLALQGAAGTGKTTVLDHIRKHAELAGYEVKALAPTASAVGELSRAGFKDAVTIDRYLVDPRQRQRSLFSRKRLVIVDEAAMVGSSRMHQLVTGAVKAGARLLLVGDTKQLHSVDAGDALRIMQKESTLQTFKLEEVFRQKGAYRAAIETLRHDPRAGFEHLERLGAVKELPADSLIEGAVDQHLHWSKVPLGRRGKTAEMLTVCPTWDEIKQFTSSLRARLKASGRLGKEKTFTRYEAVKWGTLAERRDLSNYRRGHVLVFHTATKKVAKGQAVTVGIVDGRTIHGRLENGRQVKLTVKQAKCFSVFRSESIAVAAGDRLMLQANRSASRRPKGLRRVLGGKPFTAKNGELVTVKGFTLRGELKLTDGRVIPSDYRQFTHGYAVTVHASQGKTVDRVLVVGERMSRSHFYVAASRGRQAVAVYTTNRDRFVASISQSSDRPSAHDVFRESEADRLAQEHAQRQAQETSAPSQRWGG